MNWESIGNLIIVLGLVSAAILFTTVNINYTEEDKEDLDEL